MTTESSNSFQQALRQMRGTYLEELPEKLDRIEALLLDTEKRGPDRENFDELYRLVHSMKGSAGTFGLHVLTKICHQLEDLLSTTESGANLSAALVAPCLSHLDLLRQTTTQYQAGEESFPQIEEQLGRLRQQASPKLFSVLLVDNSKLSVKLYRQLLASLPVKITSIDDGPVALMSALTESFDLIITSYEVPLLNGVALIVALKLSDGLSKGAKTILISSNEKIATAGNRTTDADYTIVKDSMLAENLINAVQNAIAISKDAV